MKTLFLLLTLAPTSLYACPDLSGTFNSTHSEFDNTIYDLEGRAIRITQDHCDYTIEVDNHTGLFGTPKVLRADNIAYDRSPSNSDAFVPATEASRSQVRTFIKSGVLYVTELSVRGVRESIKGCKEVLKLQTDCRYYVSTYSLEGNVFSEVRNGFIYFETYNEPHYIFYKR